MENRNFEKQEDPEQNDWQINADENQSAVFEYDSELITLYATDDDDEDDDIGNDDDDDDDDDAGDWGDVDPQGHDGLGSGNEPTAPGSAV